MVLPRLLQWSRTGTPDALGYTILLDDEELCPPFVPLKADVEAQTVRCAVQIDGALLRSPDGHLVTFPLHGYVEIRVKDAYDESSSPNEASSLSDLSDETG